MYVSRLFGNGIDFSFCMSQPSCPLSAVALHIPLLHLSHLGASGNRISRQLLLTSALSSSPLLFPPQNMTGLPNRKGRERRESPAGLPSQSYNDSAFCKHFLPVQKTWGNKWEGPCILQENTTACCHVSLACFFSCLSRFSSFLDPLVSLY